MLQWILESNDQPKPFKWKGYYGKTIFKGLVLKKSGPPDEVLYARE